MTQPGASKHLRVLREVGLVRDRKSGKQRLYSLDARELRPRLTSGPAGSSGSGTRASTGWRVHPGLGGKAGGGVADERDGTRSAGAVRDGRPRDRHLPDRRSPRELVFEAFTEVRHLSQWWGPDGSTTTTRAFEFRVGGEWDFVIRRTGRDGLPGVDLLDRDRPARSESCCCTVSPAATRSGSRSVLTLRARQRGDRDQMARFPHQGTARRGGREVPRDRGRPADPEQPGCLRHRDRSKGS